MTLAFTPREMERYAHMWSSPGTHSPLGFQRTRHGRQGGQAWEKEPGSGNPGRVLADAGMVAGCRQGQRRQAKVTELMARFPDQ